MFPKPQAVLPLPGQPGLEQYKKCAKELLRAANAPDSDAIKIWSTNWVKGLVEQCGIQFPPLHVDVDGWIRDIANFASSKLSNSGKLADA